VVFSNEVYSTFTAMSSRNLLSDHVLWYWHKKQQGLKGNWKPLPNL